MTHNSRFNRHSRQRRALRVHPAILAPIGLAVVLAAAALPNAGAQPAAAPASAASASAVQSVRPETLKPLQAAQEALRAGRNDEALAKLAEAEAVPGTTPYESYLIARMKAVGLFAAGKADEALKSFERAIESGLAPTADRIEMTEAAAKLALQQKDYPRALKWMKSYFDASGPNAELRQLYPQVLAISGDHAAAVAEWQKRLAADDAAGRAPTEATLRMLAGSQGEIKDEAGYAATLTRLAVLTGKPEYWRDLLARAVGRPGFAQERWRLDVYRLKQALGLPLSAAEQADYAASAMRAGLPGEAQTVIEAAFAAKTMGASADDRKLRDAIVKAANADRATLADGESAARNAKDGNAAVNQGFAMSGMGQHERAVTLMQAGIAKGGLRQPEEAQLHLGIAQWRAGQKDDAAKSFAAVTGGDGAADLARLWTLRLNAARPTQ